MTDLTEKLLVYKVQTKKDTEAFGALYDRYIESIYRFVFFKVSNREEAEDLTSEVFLKAWNLLSNNPDKEIKTFRGLLYRIARNCIIDFYRSRAVRQEAALQETEEMGAEDGTYEALLVAEDVERVLAALKKMKREYHDVILLRYVEDMSVAEIADALEKNRTNVRVTLHRALKVLKTILNNGSEQESV